MFIYTTISNILFYCLKGYCWHCYFDSSFELVNILPGKFPETRDSVQRKQVYKPNIFKYLQGYVCVHFRYQAGPCEGRGQHAVQ